MILLQGCIVVSIFGYMHDPFTDSGGIKPAARNVSDENGGIK